MDDCFDSREYDKDNKDNLNIINVFACAAGDGTPASNVFFKNVARTLEKKIS